ncbi:MAG: hypothetical protein IJ012_02650 [Clostridia bacterium]|nr:hypothetical protein [Clostridia bacterium]
MSEYQNIPQEENEKSIDLRELLTVLVSRAVWIALAVAVCLTAAFCYTKITVKPQYRSNITLRFVRGTMNVASDVAMATYMAEDFAQMAVERPVLEQVIENLSLETSYSALLSKVKVDYTKESRILRISVTDAYPKRAQAILDEICNVTKGLMIDDEATSYRVEGVSMPAERVASPMVRNLLVAALIGFVGSAGVFILIYVLDDKLKTPDHIQRALGISTLGTIPYQRLREEIKEENANG